MTDGVIKGTGTSRYIKGPPNSGTLWPTHEEFMAALAAGEVTIDLAGINPSGWTTQGTKLNKGNLLADSTAAALGLSAASATPNTAFLGALKVINNGYQLIGEYKSAGSYTFTFPDLFYGQNYDVFVIVIGGGGSGGAVVVRMSSGNQVLFAATGGCSGQFLCKTETVVPGTTASIVVGSGGSPATITTSFSSYGVSSSGNAGGSSSYKGTLTAIGGGCGVASWLRNHALGIVSSYEGGQIADDMPGGNSWLKYTTLPWNTVPSFDVKYDTNRENQDNTNRYSFHMLSPFSAKYPAVAGGGLTGRTSDAECHFVVQTKPVFLSGSSAANFVDTISSSLVLTGETPTIYGAGSGACGMAFMLNSTPSLVNVKSGKGADGAVLIFTLGRP